MTDSALLILNGPGLADFTAGGSGRDGLSLDQVREQCSRHCRNLGLEIDFRQADDEKKIFRWITQDSKRFAGLVINPAENVNHGCVDFDGYHSAIATTAHLEIPVVEVHMVNIFRDGGRPLQPSRGAIGLICGLGLDSYLLAIDAIANRLGHRPL